MRAKPQFRQHFSLFFFKIAKTVFRAVPGLRYFYALRFWELRYFCACMHAKPQFRQHFILTLLDIRAQVSARSGSDSFFFSFFCLVIFPTRILWVLDFCHLHARETPVSATFYLQAFSHSWPRFREKRFGKFFFALFILSFCRSRVLWVLDFCRVHAPEAAVLAPVSSEFDFPSCSKSLRSPENPCPNLNNVRVPSAHAHQRTHAQTIITFVFQVHTLTKEPMPKP